jgi:hypothetical protein
LEKWLLLGLVVGVKDETGGFYSIRKPGSPKRKKNGDRQR